MAYLRPDDTFVVSLPYSAELNEFLPQELLNAIVVDKVDEIQQSPANKHHAFEKVQELYDLWILAIALFVIAK